MTCLILNFDNNCPKLLTNLYTVVHSRHCHQRKCSGKVIFIFILAPKLYLP